MGRYGSIRDVENDLAAVVAGGFALQDLELEVGKLLRRGRLSDAEAHDMWMRIAAARTGLATAREWESWVRNGRHLGSERL